MTAPTSIDILFQIIGILIPIFIIFGIFTGVDKLIKHQSLNQKTHRKTTKKYFNYKILGVEDYDKQLEQNKDGDHENVIEINYQPYKKKEYLLSASEYKFYRVLRNMLDSKYVLFVKVRIADIIEPKQRMGQYILFSRIKAKHVDFLVCYKNPVRPRIAIELDGSSHELYERMERDKFVDEVFANAGIPIVHIKVADWYDKEELKERIRTVDKIKYVIKQKED